MRRKNIIAALSFTLTLLFYLSGTLSSCVSADPLNLNGNYDYSNGWYHRVQKNDTVITIAKKYDRSPRVIAHLNRLKINTPLKAGAYIYIPPTNSYNIHPRGKSSEPSNRKTSTHSQRKAEHRGSSVSTALPSMPPFPGKTENRKKPRTNDQTRGADKEPENRPSKTIRTERHVSSSGFIRPLQGTITRKYSDSENNPHKGIDIAAEKGSIVRAAASGKVIYSDDGIPGYGKLIIIDHHRENLTSVYAHNSKLLAKTGEMVRMGDPVALVGSTGRASGNHLHFEIRKNAKPVNPEHYLP